MNFDKIKVHLLTSSYPFQSIQEYENSHFQTNAHSSLSFPSPLFTTDLSQLFYWDLSSFSSTYSSKYPPPTGVAVYHLGDYSLTSQFGGCSWREDPKIQSKISPNQRDKSIEMENINQTSEGEKFICPFPGCQREFQKRWSLTRHLRKHTGEKVPLSIPTLPYL